MNLTTCKPVAAHRAWLPRQVSVARPLERRPTSHRVLMLVAAAAALLAFPPTALSQGPVDGWSRPQIISETTGTLATTGLALAADGWGRLHLFYLRQVGESSSTIDYVYWSEQGWSPPVDVVASQRSLGSPRAAVDSAGTIHLIWDSSGVWHAQAPAAQAWSVRDWSEPELIARSASSADIVAGPDNALYVAYLDASLREILLLRSTDGAQSWSGPSSIAQTVLPDAALGEVRLGLDAAGQLHAAWTEYQLPDGWPPVGVFYARSAETPERWMPPTQVAGPLHGQIGIATVGKDDIHLVWRSTIGGDGTCHQRSADGGETWLRLDQWADGGGFSGLPSFAVDARGQLHYVIGPAQYAYWDGTYLSSYQDVATLAVRGTDSGSRSTERAALAITSGNRLHVVFETGFQEIWHTSRHLDIAPLPTPTTAVAVSPTVAVGTGTATPEPTEVVQADPAAPPFSAGSDMQRPLPTGTILALGVAPSILLVLVVVVVRLLKQR